MQRFGLGTPETYRSFIASSGWVPPRARDAYDTAEAAILSCILAAVAKWGRCYFSDEDIAEECDVLPEDVARLLSHAVRRGILSVHEAPLRPRRIEVADLGWQHWIERVHLRLVAGRRPPEAEAA